MTLNEVIKMLNSIGEEYEIDYAYNKIYKYSGSHDNKVLITDNGTIMFLFDETGTLQDLWSVE